MLSSLLSKISVAPETSSRDVRSWRTTPPRNHIDELASLSEQAEQSEQRLRQVALTDADCLKGIATSIDGVAIAVEKQVARFVVEDETDVVNHDELEAAYMKYIKAVSSMVFVVLLKAEDEFKPIRVQNKASIKVVEALQRLDTVTTEYINRLRSLDLVSTQAHAATDRASAVIHRAEAAFPTPHKGLRRAITT